MGIRNAGLLVDNCHTITRSAGQGVNRDLQPHELKPQIEIHGLHGRLVPANRVRINANVRSVRDFYLTDTVTKSMVREWVEHDHATPFVRFAMETRKSPYQPGMLHVVQRGDAENNMQLVPDEDMIADYELDVAQEHLELVGEPMDVLSLPERYSDNTDDTMTRLNFYEQLALAAFLNRVTIQERVAAHLGAIQMVSEGEIMNAGVNYRGRFVFAPYHPGMPCYVRHWTRELYDSGELDLPATQRIYAERIWRGGSSHIGGLLPVDDFEHFGGLRDLSNRSIENVTRFAVYPLGY